MEKEKEKEKISLAQQPVTRSERDESTKPEPPDLEPSGVDLLARLQEAIGGRSGRGRAFADPSSIGELIDEGYDLDQEILPVIAAVAATSGRDPRSWAYFVPAIREARDPSLRSQAPPGPSDAEIEAGLAEARRRLAAKAFNPDPVG